jgi:hypothetical protein
MRLARWNLLNDRHDSWASSKHTERSIGVDRRNSQDRKCHTQKQKRAERNNQEGLENSSMYYHSHSDIAYSNYGSNTTNIKKIPLSSSYRRGSMSM